MTDEELQEIETRANKATPGPWRSEERAHNGSVYEASEDGVERIAECWCGAARGHGGTNAAFIAHARTDVPALVAEVRRLRTIEAAARAYVRSRSFTNQAREAYDRGECTAANVWAVEDCEAGAEIELRAMLGKEEP